jgi:hypothetical protein
MLLSVYPAGDLPSTAECSSGVEDVDRREFGLVVVTYLWSK